MTRNLFGDFLRRRLLTDFRRGDLFGRCRYPLGSEKAIHLRFKKICVNLWDKNNPTKKNLRHLRNLRDKNNPTKKNLRHLRNLRDKNNPTKKNLCISVKSVGQNPPTKKNLRHLRNLRDQKQQEHISGASHWPAAKYLRKSVSNPISKTASDSSVKSDEKKRVCHKSMTHPLFLYNLYPKLSYMMLSGSTPRESR